MTFKTIVKELLFFIQGDTDAKKLNAQGVHIWNKNTSKSFLQSRHLKYELGDMGPMYGFNWRHFGAKYNGCNVNYGGQGYDQLRVLLESLTRDPNSRRHLMTTFDPSTVELCVLYPCHGLTIQFYVDFDNDFDPKCNPTYELNKGKLSCKMYQRSVDVGLGYPFNIASYALLVYLLCEVTQCSPGKLIMTLGDVHIYKEHVAQLKLQSDRVPLLPPTVKILTKCPPNSTIVEKLHYLTNIQSKDITLVNYNHYGSLKMDLIY